MNRLMWSNPATQANVATLESRGIHVWGPGEGDQACGEVGAGRMLEPTQLAAYAANAIAPTGPLAGKHVLLTAGPPVNASTRCDSSAIAAPGRWASRWPRQRA
jgi:phosphopantothenoylcysteine decarboxylase/phosphopantothenate--cysteine ligase